MTVRVALVGGGGSVATARALVDAGYEVVAVANTGGDHDGIRPDVEALSSVGRGVHVIPVTDDPNPTTVVIAGKGEVAATAWVADGRPGRVLAVRMAGSPRPHPDLAAALAGVTASVLGPDDADLVIDPVLKVLAQGGQPLPGPVVASGHHHHRFEGFADHHVESDDPAAVVDAVKARSLRHG